VFPVPIPEQPAPTGTLAVDLPTIRLLTVLCAVRLDHRLGKRDSMTDPAAICAEKGHIVPASRLTNRRENL
jgi:hypothetical protein